MRAVTAEPPPTTAFIDVMNNGTSSQSSLNASTSSPLINNIGSNFHSTVKSTSASSSASINSTPQFETTRSQSAPNGIPLTNCHPSSSPIRNTSISTSTSNTKSQRPLSTQQPSWFAGLRSRISQLSMPEWLSQLGIGVSSSSAQNSNNSISKASNNNINNAANKTVTSPIRTKTATSKSGKLAAKTSTEQSTPTRNRPISVVKKNSYPALTPLLENTMISGVDYVNESYMFPLDYHFHTLNGAPPNAGGGLTKEEIAAVIPLEDSGEGKCDVENFTWDWTIDSSIWNTINGGGEYANDTLVVQHFGPLKNLLNCCQHPGKGHNFQSMSMAHPTWCDKCGDFMWGFLTHAVKCDSCNYTCHARCRALVTLDCKTVDSSLKHSSEAVDVVDSTDAITKAAITAPVVNLYPDIRAMALRDDQSDVSAKSDKHVTPTVVVAAEPELENLKAVDHQEKDQEDHEKENDGSDITTGSVQIHMNFTRPINVVAGQTPPSFVDVVNGSDTATANTVRTITTFFLPRNTVKTVNISSRMTTREMIVILLRKFRVADNPRKFALYEYTATNTNVNNVNGDGRASADHCDNLSGVDQTCDNYRYNFQRVPDDAYPLCVVNEWKKNGNNGQHKHLVLQENDTGDILWDMFELPELENFLKILDDEERQYSFRIRQKYDTYRFYLIENLRKRGHFDESELCSFGEQGIAHHSSENANPFDGITASSIINSSFGNNNNPFETFKEKSLIDKLNVNEYYQQQQHHREMANIIPSAPEIHHSVLHSYNKSDNNNDNNSSVNSVGDEREVC